MEDCSLYGSTALYFLTSSGASGSNEIQSTNGYIGHKIRLEFTVGDGSKMRRCEDGAVSCAEFIARRFRRSAKNFGYLRMNLQAIIITSSVDNRDDI